MNNYILVSSNLEGIDYSRFATLEEAQEEMKKRFKSYKSVVEANVKSSIITDEYAIISCQSPNNGNTYWLIIKPK